MTPEQMDEAYPRMRPRMSEMVANIAAWLDGEWSDEELETGRQVVLPVDAPKGDLIAGWFISQGWSLEKRVGPATVVLVFHQ